MSGQGETVLSTPWFQIAIRNEGREIIISVHGDIRQSFHHSALAEYVKKILAAGVTRYNVAHIYVPGCDRSINLWRGDRRLDLVYEVQGRLRECELKTHADLGVDRTWRHLTDLYKRCENLIVLVPLSEIENANQILSLLDLRGKVKVDTYEGEIRL